MKKIIIIGGGISGLASGIFALKKGYNVEIYEEHFLPGGMCTSWKRKGFTFEGCFHYIKLLGKSNNSIFYNIWKELGIFDNIDIISQEYLYAYKDKPENTIYIYTEPKKLRDELLKNSPEDRKKINELYKAIKRCYWFTHSANSTLFGNIIKYMNILLALPFLFKYGKLNMRDYVENFKNSAIKEALSKLFEYNEISCIQLPMFLGLYMKEGVGYPKGSTLALARTIEKTFVGLGGKIFYKSKVKKIIIENEIATGILLENGNIISGDIIVSSMDSYKTINDLIENKYVDSNDLAVFEHHKVYSSYIQVSLGINKKLPNLPYALKFKTKNEFDILGKKYNELFITHYDYDESLAPQGKSTMIILFPSEIEMWKPINYQSEEYYSQKEIILNKTIELLEEVLPDISSFIEVSDVATPYTTIRYTNNWKGALGFLPTGAYMEEMRKQKYTVGNVKNLYLSSQWVHGMGVPSVALGSKKVIETIYKNEKFQS